MRKFWIGFLWFLAWWGLPLQGQTFDYGNGWIVQGQPYVKLLVWEDGIWRVQAGDLVAAGMDTTGLDASRLQLWYRGEQQYIHIEPGMSGGWSYLEFFGRRNDGAVDSNMYVNPHAAIQGNDNIQPNLDLSVFSDTSAYFLTYGSTPGLRLTTFSQTNYSAYVPVTSFRYEAIREFHPDDGITVFNKGGGAQYDIQHVLNCAYITGEGYVGSEFWYGNYFEEDFSTPFAANNGVPYVFTSRLYHRSTWLHLTKTFLNGNQIALDSIRLPSIKTRSYIQSGNLGATTQVRFEAWGPEINNTDYNNVCWYSFAYDRLPNMGGAQEIKVLEWNQGGTSYLRMANAAASGRGILYDPANHQRILGTVSGDTIHTLIPGFGNARNDLFLGSDQSVKTPQLVASSLANLSSTANGGEMILITHRLFTNSATAYQNYRDTATVNPLQVRIVYTDEIYDEFGYGTITPLAIKRFCKYALDHWGVKPTYFLLWGKGQYLTRHHPSNFVPTWGYPATDYEYVTNFVRGQTEMDPEASIGRINITSDVDGHTYLNKVNIYEHTPWDSWMKTNVFFGGGETVGEQMAVLHYLRDEFKPYVEGAPLGGIGLYFQNMNNGLVSNSPVPSKDVINGGTRLIHFFGHSSSNIYDVDILEPVQYLNYSKFPMMVAFGCYGGDFTTDSRSFGERFVLEPSRGSIGYLANSTAGYLSQLGEWGRNFYPFACGTMIDQPIGKIVAETNRNYFNTYQGDQTSVNTSFQLNLQCDPSIRIFSPSVPDYEITTASVYFNPTNFSAADSTYSISVIVKNNGRVPTDSSYLSVRQLLPSGSWYEHPNLFIPPVFYQDTFTLLLRNLWGSGMAGINQYDVFVDSTLVISEYNETNNRILLNVVVPGQVPAILYPYDFAVIDTPRVKLAASAYVINNQAHVPFLFEIDTVPDFNSPLYSASGPIDGTSFYAEWEVPFNLQDCTIYYWRVRLQNYLPPTWATASFKYIPGREGWGQSAPPQFFKDPTYRITMNRLTREWELDPRTAQLHAFTYPNGNAAYRLDNGAFLSYLPGPAYNGLFYTPINQKTLAPTITNTIFGDWNISLMPNGESPVITAIAQTPPGDYFLISTERDAQIGTWNDGLFDALATIGTDTARLRTLQPGESFIVVGKKGSGQSAVQVFEPNVFDSISGIRRLDINTGLNARYLSGKISSVTIGPAIHWEEFIYDWETLDPFEAENVKVSLYGVRYNNTDTLLFANLVRGTYSLAGVNPDSIPMLRLEAVASDSQFATAPQLDHWYVVGTLAPDAIIDPVNNWGFVSDTLVIGDPGMVRFRALNKTQLGMDSLLVKFSVLRADRTVELLGFRRYAPLAAKDTLELVYNFQPGGHNLMGNLTFQIELNPNHDQAELYHFNNLYSFPFFIEGDHVNPLLDVMFDGKRIMEGDIVSPQPEILVQLNDENQYIAVEDTAFELYFGPRSPGGTGLQRIYLNGNSHIRLVSAQLPENKAKLYFTPDRLQDGEYTLKVQGYDKEGNPAGPEPYEINFEVVNESTLGEVLNYPNPFSTNTRFVYTLTGDELPELFQIHIYTVSGRLVKVVDLNELGEVKFGHTITQYAWDGTDDFGDQLANGLYIYRVVARIHGEEIKYRDEGVSAFFKNGLGKMYLMR